MSTWTINDASPESLGMAVVSAQFNSGRASTVQLACKQAFDGSEVFAHGATVTIERDDVKFFQGKVRAIPKSGSAATEGHDYLVEDAWAELELLTYQEPWQVRQADYSGPIYSPTVILGMSAAGTRISTGEQIEEVLAFAISQGVPLAIGSIPAGMALWPSEAVGQSCAAIIRDCLKYFPDWMPWLDYTATVPVFHITPRASATAVDVGVSDCTRLDVTKTQDRVPAGVRIVYTTANVVNGGDGEPAVFRNVQIDQAPRPGGLSDAAWRAILTAPAGPGILVTTVELDGMQVQVQKQQVQTRDLPTTSTDAKEYLKSKYPIIKDVPDAHIDITAWTTLVIPDDLTEADAIDTKIPRVPGSTRGQLPRELVKGVVTEWMRKKVGKVLVECTVEAASGASEDSVARIAKLPSHFSVIATNATTKTYQGISSYSAPESVPVGIAQAFYDTLVSGCYFEGSLTLTGAEIPAVTWGGSKLNLTGSSITEWGTMGAPIHSVIVDVGSAETVVNFGPNPDYSFQDFLEYLKLLNKRPYSQYTTEERAGDEYGNAAGPSARGDSVGPYDIPETITAGGAGGGRFDRPFQLVASGTAGDNILKVRESTLAGAVPAGFTAGFKEFTISASGVIYAKLTINGTTGAVTARAVENGATLPANTDTVFHDQIGSYTVTGSGGAAVISATNTRYGPIPANICRNWYAAAAPYYGVTFL